MGVAPSTAQHQSPTAPTLALVKGTSDASSNGGFLPEILELLAEFLVGYDVLQLSHVNAAFRAALATPSVWAWRMNGHTDTAETPQSHAWCAEQTAYFRARSLRFRGLESIPTDSKKKPRHPLVEKMMVKLKPEIDCGDACELPFMLLPEEDGRLSFDLWFSLLATDTPGSGGGILFGAQHQSCFTPNTSPHHFDRFVHIDPQRNLYCSVLVGKPVIASDLQVDRWYHLALAFDGRHQHVYLDGDLVHSGMGLSRPQDKWHWTRNVQLGTGFITESLRGKPSPTLSGWYPFHGLIDECRVWYDVLSEQHIEELAQNRPIEPKPVFQLTRDKAQRHVGAYNVKCSRPTERQARVHSRREAARVSQPNN